MKRDILVSIIITNYNKEKFIYKTLKSAINLDYNNKEIIVFDDSSDDKSLEIIKKFKNIKLLKNKSKKLKSGPLNQINAIIKAFEISKGEYIFLLDGDDIFKKNKIKKILYYFSKNKNIDIIQDKPYLNKENKVLNLKIKKHLFSIWPSIYPTSCIALKREFFVNFLKYVQKDNFKNLEIDSRIVMYSYLLKKLKILKSSYTIYNLDKKGITSKYSKYSTYWWKKRKEAFDYLYFLNKKLDYKFKKGPDYFFTQIINKYI